MYNNYQCRTAPIATNDGQNGKLKFFFFSIHTRQFDLASSISATNKFSTVFIRQQLELTIEHLPQLKDENLLCAFTTADKPTIYTNATRKRNGVNCTTPRTDLLPQIAPGKRKLARVGMERNVSAINSRRTNIHSIALALIYFQITLLPNYQFVHSMGQTWCRRLSHSSIAQRIYHVHSVFRHNFRAIGALKHIAVHTTQPKIVAMIFW